MAVDRYFETANRERKVFVDMSKNFDKVKRQVTSFFLTIFFDVCMSVVVLNCIVSYLSTCKRRVVIKSDEISPNMACEREAPQDRVLGPLLFSLCGTSVNMLAITSRGLRVGWTGRRTWSLSFLKSTVRRISLVPFFRTTTIGWHQSDGSETDFIMPLVTMSSSCCRTWSRYA